MKKKTRNLLIAASGALASSLLVIWAFVAWFPEEGMPSEDTETTTVVETKTYAYGIEVDTLSVEKSEVQPNQSFSEILLNYGVEYPRIHSLVGMSKDVFDVRYIQAGKPYTAILNQKDSSSTLTHLVYEKSLTEYVVFELSENDTVFAGQKAVTKKVKEASGVIEGSLYLTLQNQDLSPVIAVKLSEIYAWTIDFFRIQKGDYFQVIYEEIYIDDTVYAGTGRIIAANFNHFGGDNYAFEYVDTAQGWPEYYDDAGNSLRKAFLKAPLSYSRISSRYSPRRFHPVQKRWKAHLGTDYAAPRGTPIMSTADGVVDRAGYTSGNGNYVKVRHNSVYSTQYLHMSKIAKGMKPGTRVKQGQTIGYVGSTGLATGPHVCFRFWKNGKQVDPFKQKLPDAEPIRDDIKADFLESMKPMKLRLEKLLPVPSEEPSETNNTLQAENETL